MLAIPTSFHGDAIEWTQTVGLLPWWLPIAAAVARRDLTNDIGRTAEGIHRARFAAGYEVVRIEAAWWSPTGEDRGRLEGITQAALSTIADRGIRIAAAAQVQLRRELTTPHDARVEIRIVLDTVTPARAH